MTLLKCFFALTILGVLTLSAPARADVAPDDECSSVDVGKACDNAPGAGSQFQPGVCKETMCTRASPNGSMTFTCYRCVAESGGSGGQANQEGGTSSGGSANTAGTKSSAGSSSASKSSDDGGCSVSEARGGAGALGGMWVVLGLTVAGLRRRRATAS